MKSRVGDMDADDFHCLATYNIALFRVMMVMCGFDE